MILDVDIGNSSVKWRAVSRTTIERGRLRLDQLDTLTQHLQGAAPARVRASCVAGDSARNVFSSWCVAAFGVEPEFAFVREQCKGMKVGYDQPQRLGVDRWLAMLASYQQLQASQCGSGFVVIDAGSAITADFVTARGEHLGGLILPGLSLMRESLFSQTSAVKLDTLTVPQTWHPGRDTLACVEHAMAAAITGWVQEVIRYGENHCGDGLVLLACGGDADVIASRNSRFLVRPDLVFDGLAVALG